MPTICRRRAFRTRTSSTATIELRARRLLPATAPGNCSLRCPTSGILALACVALPRASMPSPALLYSGIPALAGVRATASTTQRVAPAALSSAASAFTVAPVVTTSSTIAIRRPASARRMRNARATLLRRSFAPCPAYAGVATCRSMPYSSAGTWSAWASTRAISCAWL